MLILISFKLYFYGYDFMYFWFILNVVINMLHHVFINSTTCVWPSADCTVKRLKLQWTGAPQTSSWFLAWCCSVKDVLAACVYRIHRYKIPSARQTAKYNMLFSSAARKCSKYCQAAGLTSQLRLSFFHLSTTIVTKLDFYSFGFLKLNKLSLFDLQLVRDRRPFQHRAALYSHTEATHHMSCCWRRLQCSVRKNF